jgi:hypothetical protein
VKASKALAAYKRILKSRSAKRAIDKETRTALAAPATSLQADLKGLRKSP